MHLTVYYHGRSWWYRIDQLGRMGQVIDTYQRRRARTSREARSKGRKALKEIMSCSKTS